MAPKSIASPLKACRASNCRRAETRTRCASSGPRMRVAQKASQRFRLRPPYEAHASAGLIRTGVWAGASSARAASSRAGSPPPRRFAAASRSASTPPPTSTIGRTKPHCSQPSRPWPRRWFISRITRRAASASSA